MALSRSRVTWLMYMATAAWASFIYLLGPSTPLLADDFALDTRQAGLYGAALAVGIVSGGLISSRVASRLGRSVAFRLGLVLLVSGEGVLANAPGYLDSLLGVGVAGTGGAFILSTTTATLSDVHGNDSAAAITEANALAAWIGAASPLVLGLVLTEGHGWRGTVANSGVQPDRALAIGSLVLGSAIGIAPFALGTLASVIPVREAFLLVAGLLAVGILAVLTSRPVQEAPASTR